MPESSFSASEARRSGNRVVTLGIAGIVLLLGAAGAEIAGRIGADGWHLLSVVSVFDEAGLTDAKRKENAGQFYLRY